MEGEHHTPEQRFEAIGRITTLGLLAIQRPLTQSLAVVLLR